MNPDSCRRSPWSRACPRSIALALVTALLAVSSLPWASHAEWDVDGIEELLPRQESERERLMWLGREDEMPARRGVDPPPTGPIRNCGEWEPVTGVLIRYPLGLPYSLLRDMDDNVTLHVIVSSGLLASAQTNLDAQGVDMSQVEFLVEPNDSIWSRDFGPWFVFDGSGQLGIIDHFYNRPFRPNDNLIPSAFGAQQGIPVYTHDMWHTGGNYMTDGAHISSSTRLVYNEAAANNGYSEAQVDQLMADYYGVSEYTVLDYIESGGIHHIDTWAKFLDEETVLVKEVWSTHHTYSTLEQRATLMSSLPASTGRNYQVFRVYCYNIGGGDPASYTNSLFLNDTVYVPYFGNSTWDQNAKAVYESALPGYDVRGYTHSGWLTDDALHCRAKGVMDAGMLFLAHVPVREEQTGDVPIAVEVVAHSGEAISAVDLVYRYDGGSWATESMTTAGGSTFEATIPVPPAPGLTEYYVQARDGSGREEGMPRSAPNGWYGFDHALDPSDAPVPEMASSTLSYPNPFRESTTFRFQLHHAERVSLRVYDASGRLVRDLFDDWARAGETEIAWDGRNDVGRRLPAGTYFYRLRAAGLQYQRPVVLVP